LLKGAAGWLPHPVSERGSGEASEQEDSGQGAEGMETATNQEVLEQFEALYHEVFSHDGYGDIRLEMRILRRGQKEVIIHCGKQYRFVVDYANRADQGNPGQIGHKEPQAGRDASAA
jgi:hypothetical protein